MREIKFRAWDKHDRVMTGPFDMVALNSDRNHVWVLEQEWLQYTGLKDKNGVEIYEGDIVSFDVEPNVHMGAVAWSELDGCWLFADEALNGVVRQTIEIIGNIYENAELLNPKGEA